MADDYTRGEMDISHHKATFDGVMSVSVFCSLLTAVVVLFLTLVFAADFSWMTGLIVSVIVGGVGGYALKQGALYWVFLVALAGLGVVSGVIIGVVSSLAG